MKRCDCVKISKAYFSYFSNRDTRLDLLPASPAIWQYLKVSWAIARVQQDHSAEQSCVLLRVAGDAVERIPGWNLETCLFPPTLPLIYWVTVGKFLDGSFLFKMENSFQHFCQSILFQTLSLVHWFPYLEKFVSSNWVYGVRLLRSFCGQVNSPLWSLWSTPGIGCGNPRGSQSIGPYVHVPA